MQECRSWAFKWLPYEEERTRAFSYCRRSGWWSLTTSPSDARLFFFLVFSPSSSYIVQPYFGYTQCIYEELCFSTSKNHHKNIHSWGVLSSSFWLTLNPCQGQFAVYLIMPRIISFWVGKITHRGMKEMNGISPLQEVPIVHILQILHTCVCIKINLITPLQEVPGTHIYWHGSEIDGMHHSLFMNLLWHMICNMKCLSC